MACAQRAAPSSTTIEAAVADPYHTPPSDTLDAATYEGWKQFSHLCARCHGEDARGTSFGPDLIAALGPEGDIKNRETFMAILATGRPGRGMPPATTLGLAPEYFDGLFDYLKGRSDLRLHGGRPALRGPN